MTMRWVFLFLLALATARAQRYFPGDGSDAAEAAFRRRTMIEQRFRAFAESGQLAEFFALHPIDAELLELRGYSLARTCLRPNNHIGVYRALPERLDEVLSDWAVVPDGLVAQTLPPVYYLPGRLWAVWLSRDALLVLEFLPPDRVPPEQGYDSAEIEASYLACAAARQTALDFQWQYPPVGRPRGMPFLAVRSAPFEPFSYPQASVFIRAEIYYPFTPRFPESLPTAPVPVPEWYARCRQALVGEGFRGGRVAPLSPVERYAKDAQPFAALLRLLACERGDLRLEFRDPGGYLGLSLPYPDGVCGIVLKTAPGPGPGPAVPSADDATPYPTTVSLSARPPPGITPAWADGRICPRERWSDHANSLGDRQLLEMGFLDMGGGSFSKDGCRLRDIQRELDLDLRLFSRGTQVGTSSSYITSRWWDYDSRGKDDSVTIEMHDHEANWGGPYPCPDGTTSTDPDLSQPYAQDFVVSTRVSRCYRRPSPGLLRRVRPWWFTRMERVLTHHGWDHFWGVPGETDAATFERRPVRPAEVLTALDLKLEDLEFKRESRMTKTPDRYEVKLSRRMPGGVVVVGMGYGRDATRPTSLDEIDPELPCDVQVRLALDPRPQATARPREQD